MPNASHLSAGLNDDGHLLLVCEAVVGAMDCAGLGVAIVALGHHCDTFLYVSVEALEILGRREDELLGSATTLCAHAVGDTLDRGGGNQEENGPLSYEARCIKSDGSSATVHLLDHRIHHGAERLAVLILSRAKVDAALLSTPEQQAAALLQQWIELLPLPAATLFRGTLVWANTLFKDLIGLDSDAGFEGSRLADWFLLEDRNALEQEIDDTAEGRRDFGFTESRTSTGTGLPRTIELKLGRPFDNDSARILVLGRDITSECAANRATLRTDRLAALGLLAGGIAHSINNPLTYVFLNLEHLCQQLTLGPMDASEAGELGLRVAEAQQGAERMAAVVKRMRMFARDDESSPYPVDLRAVIDATLELVGNEIRHRADFFIRCDNLPKVRGSRTRLEQVFLNLLLCAAQSIPEGSRERCTVSVTAHQSGRTIVCDVVYHPAPNLDELSAAFEQHILADSLDPIQVGISVCDHILKSLGGSLALLASPGPAAVFRVTLPVSAHQHSRPNADLRQSSIPPSRPQRGRILVVDDDPAVGRALRLMLQDDHEVVFEESPGAALRTLLADPTFDVVFCDLMMPVLGGSDIYHALRLNRPGQEKQLIFMTGGAFTANAEQFLTHVPNRRIDKPFSIDALQSLVRRSVKQRR